MTEIVMVRGTLDGQIKTDTAALSDVATVNGCSGTYLVRVKLQSGVEYKCDGVYFK